MTVCASRHATYSASNRTAGQVAAEAVSAAAVVVLICEESVESGARSSGVLIRVGAVAGVTRQVRGGLMEARC